MMRALFLLSVAASLWAAGAAAAPPSSSADDRPIIVQSERNRDRQIRDFVKELTPAPIRGQLARFELPVCPVVLGIVDAQARVVEERMRQIAAAVGLPVAPPKCLANMALFVAPSKAGLLTELERWPFMFPEEWSQGRIDAMKRDPSPVAVWHSELVMWNGGSELSGRDAKVPDPFNDSTKLRGSRGIATRLQPSARPMLKKSVVVIQSDAIAGLTPVQLADYAVMRSLVRTDPKQLSASSPSTILSILDAPMGAAVPITMTEWDMSFLKSFYSSTKNMYAEYQRAQMKGAMKRELEKQQKAQQ